MLDATPESATPSVRPYVTVTLRDGKEEIATNLPPEMRPLIYWLLSRARLTVLTQLSEQEKSTIVKPNGRVGFLKRMHG